ncbi:MAG: hypothetical protein GKR90_17455 [Pseudomonadales bacterium]|nr:hypothetical protein [Pseudomonadales bacterium]
MINVLQITDCHLVVEDALLIGVDTQASLEAVLRQATAERKPDAVLASGDLAHDPMPAVYERFLTTVQEHTDAPLVCAPGNHDVLAAMSGLPQKDLQIGNWAIVNLDSHEDESTPASVSAQDRERVQQAFAETDADHVLLSTHHPFVAVGAPWLDRDRIQNPEELVKWLAECSRSDSDPAESQSAGRIRAIVFGHAHQEVSGHCENVPVYGAPSTCFQFKPRSQTFAIDDEGDGRHPGFRWIELDEDGAVTTQVGRAKEFLIEPELRR